MQRQYFNYNSLKLMINQHKFTNWHPEHIQTNEKCYFGNDEVYWLNRCEDTATMKITIPELEGESFYKPEGYTGDYYFCEDCYNYLFDTYSERKYTLIHRMMLQALTKMWENNRWCAHQNQRFQNADCEVCGYPTKIELEIDCNNKYRICRTCVHEVLVTECCDCHKQVRNFEIINDVPVCDWCIQQRERVRKCREEARERERKEHECVSNYSNWSEIAQKELNAWQSHQNDVADTARKHATYPGWSQPGW